MEGVVGVEVTAGPRSDPLRREMQSRFDITDTAIEGVRLLQRKPITDHRGFFERLFSAHELEHAMHSRRVVEINRSLTRRQGSVRGLHFQRPPYAETKLVTCLRGRVFDVAVDIRRGSPTFLHWHGEMLCEDDHRTLLMPEGIAHGFQTLTDDCELLYFHTAAYEPSAEGALNARDPRLGIVWPLPIAELSTRDLSYPMTAAGFEGLKL